MVQNLDLLQKGPRKATSTLFVASFHLESTIKNKSIFQKLKYFYLYLSVDTDTEKKWKLGRLNLNISATFSDFLC